jgi:hypothetical protein
MKRKSYSLISIFVVCSIILNYLIQPASAAGVAVSVTSPANAEFAALTATDVTFRYDPSSTEFASADTITVTISPSVPNIMASCASPTTDIDGDTTGDGSFGSFTTSGAVYTLSAATTQATTNYATMCTFICNTKYI